MVIIGDIHGQYSALCRLIENNIPKDEEIILVGDVIDRGMWSPECVQYCIDNKFTVVKGNHESMMVDYYEQTLLYDNGLWLYNGGRTTALSYRDRKIDWQPHVDWMKSLPYYIIRDNYFISHAPMVTNKRKDQEGVEFDLMWNREEPGSRIKGEEKAYKQVFGHMSNWGVKYFKFSFDEDASWYGLCVDSTQSKMITAYCTTDGKLYQEPY